VWHTARRPGVLGLGGAKKPRRTACFERVVHADTPAPPPLLQSVKKPLHNAPAVDFLFILV